MVNKVPDSMLESGGDLAKLSSSDFTDLKKGGVDVPNLDEVTSMVSTALTPRGDWDASLGSFPTPTMSPERADFYHITVAGTMSDANPAQNDVEVQVGDNLYWHIDRDVWYKIDNTEKITSVNGRTSGAINLDDDYFTETELGSSSGSSLIGYDNTVSELTATDVQAAIDEVANKSSAALTQAQFEANRAIVNEVMAASGFVHFGKHGGGVDYTAVNQGISSRTNSSAWANRLLLGRDDADATGESKTNYPVVNIAGVISNLSSIGFDGLSQSWVKFPDAPDGTVTYDSATGAITDFTTDVDPKYGDVAGTQSEAVARAFEGEKLNGDFRLGDVHWNLKNSCTVTTAGAFFDGLGVGHCGDMGTDSVPVGETRKFEAVFKNTSGSSANVRIRVGDTTGGTEGVSYKTFTVEAGMTAVLVAELGVNPSNNTGYPLLQQMSAFTGEMYSFSMRPATIEVVTDRVDHFGLEGYLEEVTLLNPHVYPNGLIQSQATTMNGIPTVRSNRPESYYAVFTGDTTSAGLGVNYWAASDAEKAAMRADPDNNIYLGADGKTYQWRVRQRTIAGAGNGDWLQLDSTANGLTGRYLRWGDGATYLIAQGMRDALPSTPFSVYQDGLYAADAGLHQTSGLTSISAGTFSALNSTLTGRNTETGINGECYWLPLGTVTRLNQGAFHPSFNPLGANTFWDEGGTISSNLPWHDDRIYQPISKADCFNFQVGRVAARGYIAVGVSGRNDDRFYDAIYADGQGGVQQDLRLSAQGGTISDILGTEDAKTKNGTQRGLQKLVYSKVSTTTDTGVYSGNPLRTWVYDSSIYDQIIQAGYPADTPLAGNTLWINVEGAVYEVVLIISSVKVFLLHERYGDVSSTFPLGTNYVMTWQLETSVSGEFSQTDVIGDPAQILATPDLANGWLGNWVPDDYSTSASAHRDFTRKLLGTSYTYTHDNGTGNWNQTVQTADNIANTTTSHGSLDTRVALAQYTAHAYMTESANNPVVYKGTEGVGDVWAGQYYFPVYGMLVVESLLKEVMKSAYVVGGVSEDMKLVTSTIDYSDGKLEATWADIKHQPINLTQPTNNSHGCKTLSLVAEENGQLFLYYLSTELIWDTTLDNATEFVTADSSVSTAYSKGTLYYFTAGNYKGATYLAVGDFTSVIDDGLVKTSNGDLRNQGGILLMTLWSGNGWGDDNLITVLNGEGTKTDLNGNTVKVSCHKVPYALGWVKINT